MVNPVRTFQLASIPKIEFGSGVIHKIGSLCASLGKRPLLVTGKSSFEESPFRDKIEKSLKLAGLSFERYIVSGEPSPKNIDDAIDAYRDQKPDVVVAIGGGSVLDAGKAISAMFCEEGSVKNYLEGVGDKSPSGRRIGFIAVPTTAGTGSETTKNAVLSEQGAEGFKKSLRHDLYIPDLALVDPNLSIACSIEQTCASGMDAFTQLLESYLSTKANAFTDSLALSGLEAISRSLYQVFKQPDDISARSDMAYAAMLSGITLANAGLGVIHGFAQPLGSMFPIPHGIVCGTLMGAVNRHSVRLLREHGGGQKTLQKYSCVGQLFCSKSNMSSEYYTEFLLERIDSYIAEFPIPDLSGYGIREQDISAIIDETGLKNHPVPLSREDLEQILKDRL